MLIVNKFKSLALIFFTTTWFLAGCNTFSIKPQGGATFKGNMKAQEFGHNSTASGGYIEFTVSDKGDGITSMTYSLSDAECSIDCSLSFGNGAGMTMIYAFSDPIIEDGSFILNSNSFMLEGTFISPTEAKGTINIQHEIQCIMSLTSQTDDMCDWGTWAWSANVEE